MTKIIDRILSRKTDLQTKISQAKQAAIDSEVALRLVDELEKTIDGKTESLKSRAYSINIAPEGSSAPEDSLGGAHDLLAEAEAVAALEELRADLPALKKHWLAQREALTA